MRDSMPPLMQSSMPPMRIIKEFAVGGIAKSA